MMESKRYTCTDSYGNRCGAVSYYFCVGEHGFEFDFGFSYSHSYKNIKRVIKLMMYLRNIKGLSLAKLPVSVMKASVKNLLLLTDESLWRNDASLETCFIAALDNLLTRLKKNSICSPFYPEVNLLDQIKNQEVKDDIIGCLDNILIKYDMTADVMGIFSLRA